MKKEHIHFIGIGGIGVSALARFYCSKGYRASGSDLARSEITDALKKEGIHVFIGRQKAANIAVSVTKVVYTAAAKPDNPEIQSAKKRGIPVLSYAQALGELTEQYKTIAVAGAHGKTTTTALISLALIKAGFDPTVIIGAKLREFKNSNFRLGRSPYLVLEADEWKASFLNYSPTIAVITNIDREHLDFYKNITNIESAFLHFLIRLNLINTMSWAVLNADDPRLRRIGKQLHKKRPDIKIVWFSLRDAQAKRIRAVLQIPGQHNIANALAALAVNQILRIPEKKFLSAISSYRGAWRRFDYQGKLFGAKVFADYAHHPTEIKATLQAAREKFPRSRIICVFQPHHYERTKNLFQEFTRAFDAVDGLVLLDIYEVAGRERKRKSSEVNSQKLAEAVARRGVEANYLANAEKLKPFLKGRLGKNDILLMMGAGSIWEMTKHLMNSKIKMQNDSVKS